MEDFIGKRGLAPFLAIVSSCLLAGCGETRHPVREEKITPAAPAPAVDAPPRGADAGNAAPSLPPSHPPISPHGMAPAAPVERNPSVTVPEGWIVKQPKMSMIQAEFALSKAEGDETDGRLTVMTVGGTIDQNIQRWKGQFADLENADAKPEEIEVDGMKVTFVDFSGTYQGMGMQRPGPDYRMLAAILPADGGNLFIKAYGPKNTMAKHAEAFRQFVQSTASSGKDE